MFGGAVAISAEQFISINGFSNNYWDNDADYEDLYKRYSGNGVLIVLMG